MSMSAKARIRLTIWRLRLARVLPELHPASGEPPALWPWVALGVGILLPWTAGPIITPDTGEMLAAGQCMLGLSAGEAVCSGLDAGRYPVLFPILGGLSMAAGLSPLSAALGLALLAGALACAATTHALERDARLAAILVPGLVLAVPGLRAHLLTGDARGLLLLGLVGAIGWMWRKDSSGWALGGWLALALLARPEAPIAVGAVLLLTLFWRRSALWRALPVVGLAWAVQYMLQLSGSGSRGWEMKLSPLAKIIPDDWIFQLVGLGMGPTSFRSRLIEADLPAQPSTFGAWDWLQGALPQSIPIWLGLGALVGLGVLLMQRRWKHLVLIAVLASPASIVLVAAQAREQMLPAANLLPALLGMCLLAALGLEACLYKAAAKVASSRQTSTQELGAVGLLICLLLGSSSTYVQMHRLMELGSAHEAAWRWVEANTPPNEPIAVSFRTGGILLLAKRARVPLPTSWEVASWLEAPDRPSRFILSSLDSPSTHATTRQLDALCPPVEQASFTDPASVIWVYGLDCP
jgi:hypothetical protein